MDFTRLGYMIFSSVAAMHIGLCLIMYMSNSYQVHIFSLALVTIFASCASIGCVIGLVIYGVDSEVFENCWRQLVKMVFAYAVFVVFIEYLCCLPFGIFWPFR